MAEDRSVSRAAGAVDDLYRAHAGDVYRYAYAMLGNRSDAEDVTQTTFVNALRALERGERPRTPSNWLTTIARNLVRQRFRQQQARPLEVELDHDVAIEEPESHGPSLDDLVRALQRIPPTQREALVLRELEGRSYKELEVLLGVTGSALETLLFRARRSLAEELENLFTCERAELAMSQQADGRLSRKDRRRLNAHVEECPSCARLDAGRSKSRRAFRTLALLPLPLPLTLFKGAPSASAAGGLSTIGAGGVTAAAGVSVIGGGSAAATGAGLLAGGLAVKAVAVVAAATVAGGVGYEGTKYIRETHQAPTVRSLAAPSREAAAAARVLPGVATPGLGSPGALAAAKAVLPGTLPPDLESLRVQTRDPDPQDVAAILPVAAPELVSVTTPPEGSHSTPAPATAPAEAASQAAPAAPVIAPPAPAPAEVPAEVPAAETTITVMVPPTTGTGAIVPPPAATADPASVAATVAADPEPPVEPPAAATDPPPAVEPPATSTAPVDTSPADTAPAGPPVSAPVDPPADPPVTPPLDPPAAGVPDPPSPDPGTVPPAG